ncbi:non-ribosomal peptide synthetase [Winogradskyella psychrotolerans]|uniref:non-ribosomal peptide synthetase n=1 Tax=Winogradskyella psychrotolerans TaxID=1344585 RepID=UPI001C069C6D|nr:non-ribosomal peptide synthetase [Winogradskyella psychrotolerans]MBU2928310.1 amino acid adenylation domain-containing protein [Winogradskyella psychrotolerans]
MNFLTSESTKKESFNPFNGPIIEKVIYSTQSQVEIWLGCKFGGEDANRAYNESFLLTLNGHLDKLALEESLYDVVLRHESLRAVFSTDGQFMSILKEVPITLERHDISELKDSEKKLKTKQYLLADANFVFDLVKGPLLKASLIKQSDLKHQLILTAHHIILDGWSTGILLEELGALYSSKVSKTTLEIPDPINYSEYADDIQVFTASEEFLETEKFWKDQYKSSVPELNMPTDFPRPELRTYKSERLDFSIDKELLAKLKKTGVKAGCSFVTTLMTAFELFLCKQTGQNDIVLGLPAAGQSVTGKTQLIGHCVNLLPLRSQIILDETFNTYLKHRKSSMFDAYDHQQLSFGQLLQKLPIARDPSRVPLVPVVFNIDMGMSNLVTFADLSFELESNPRTFEAFELFLNASGSEEDFILEWQYNTSLFKPSTIEKMMFSLVDIIERIVENPERTISDIIKTDDTDYNKLNATTASYSDLPLHELLIKQAQKVPKKKAVKFLDTEICYEDLERQVNQLAHSLKEKGINKGDFVGVSLPRSIELLVTLLAIMKCGAAYLPLDPNYPSERLDFMINDSEAKVLITVEAFASKLETTASKFLLDDLFSDLSQFSKESIDVAVNQNDIAYLLYTSGSTGKPKGVQVSHKNVVNFLSSMAKEPGIKDSDRLLSITTISFDIAGLELFLPLLKGAQLIISDDDTARDGRLMLDLIKKENITMMQATPTTWQMLLDSGWETAFPIKALCGGESLPLALAKKLLTKVDELWNVYGPTETTIWSAVKQIKESDELITIGKPIDNTQLYLLNDQNMLVSSGAIGELCIAGDGVSLGYWKRPDLTAEKFIPNPFETTLNKTLYRTGDLGKLLSNGEVQCLGRIDDQVKIRGHRIELGEIEQVINTMADIESSVVMIDQNRLKAFVITSASYMESPNPEDKWQAHLKEVLPIYMVPNEMLTIDEFPTTLNGKIDRKALLKDATASSIDSGHHTEPRTISEQLIADIWEECLEIKNISVFSNFFELGGHSLIAVRVMALLEKETGKRMPLAALMTNSTIEKLALYMDLDFKSETWSSLVPIQTKGDKTPLYLVHGADHNVMIFKLLSNNLDANQPVYALQAKGLNGIDEPLKSVDEMVNHYISEILKSNPEGPFVLAGYSFGGVIAFEMARQLLAQHKEVKKVILLDSYVYPYYYFSANTTAKKIAKVKYKMNTIGFMTKTMFSSKANFNRRIQLFKDGIRNTYLKLKLGKENQHKLINSWPYQLDQMHNEAVNNYQILPLNITVDLLRVAEDEIFYAHDTDLLGWEPIATGGVNKHEIPGNHINMLSAPNDKKTGRILQNILDN